MLNALPDIHLCLLMKYTSLDRFENNEFQNEKVTPVNWTRCNIFTVVPHAYEHGVLTKKYDFMNETLFYTN